MDSQSPASTDKDPKTGTSGVAWILAANFYGRTTGSACGVGAWALAQQYDAGRVGG